MKTKATIAVVFLFAILTSSCTTTSQQVYPGELQDAIDSGEITEGEAKALMVIGNRYRKERYDKEQADRRAKERMDIFIKENALTDAPQMQPYKKWEPKMK